MKDKNTHIVIMAGGIGSRLWPISTPECPKQFIDVLGMGKSLIQMTVERFLPSADIGNFWVVTSAEYASIVKEQLPDIPSEHILLEPEARNTAPCIAYACRKIAAERNDFIAKLAKFKFLKVYPSAANFVLCEVKKPYTSKKLVVELWTRAGCLVKDCSSKKGFGGKSFIRIAVKSAADNAQFIAALKERK